MKKPHPDSALIFDWGRREVTAPWLVFFFFVAVLGLASLFVVFRIITPEAPRVDARPQQMIVLNPAVPAERALIHQAQDRSFTLLPTEAPGAAHLPAAARLPDFQPSIRGFEMRLKPAGSALTTRESTSLLKQDFLDSLPPLPEPEKPPRKGSPAVKKVLQARLEAGQEARSIVAGSVLQGIPLLDPSRPRFRVALGALGQVLMALPISASEEPEVMVQLHAAVTQLQFQPQPGQQDIEWAEVGFAWRKEEAP